MEKKITGVELRMHVPMCAEEDSANLRADVRKAMLDYIESLDAWAGERVRQGREVMEHEIETGIKRMRPLRPEDV